MWYMHLEKDLPRVGEYVLVGCLLCFVYSHFKQLLLHRITRLLQDVTSFTCVCHALVQGELLFFHARPVFGCLCEVGWFGKVGRATEAHLLRGTVLK